MCRFPLPFFLGETSTETQDDENFLGWEPEMRPFDIRYPLICLASLAYGRMYAHGKNENGRSLSSPRSHEAPLSELIPAETQTRKTARLLVLSTTTKLPLGMREIKLELDGGNANTGVPETSLRAKSFYRAPESALNKVCHEN